MIILDTSFLIGLKIENDEHHEDCKKLISRINNDEFGQPIINDFIFNEVLNVILKKTKNLEMAKQIGEEILKNIEIKKTNDESFENTWIEFQSQDNTKLSFTDCSIIELSKSKKIPFIATYDSEFEKIDSVKILK